MYAKDLTYCKTIKCKLPRESHFYCIYGSIDHDIENE